MRSSSVLASDPDFVVHAARCGADHRRWSAPESGGGHEIVLATAGRFRVTSDGRPVVVEPATGYLHTPGDELRFAHPAGGDVCTSIGFSARLWDQMAGAGPLRLDVQVDGRMELAHRRLLGATGTSADIAFDTVECLLDLLATALRWQPRSVPAHGRLPVADLANRAKEAILAAEPAADGLIPLAGLLGVSPFHLSRTFRAATGSTISGYRNRVRVSRALVRLESGERDLAGLAAELGFADQSHLTRTVRTATGHTPRRLRQLLGEHAPRCSTRSPEPAPPRTMPGRPARPR